MVLNARVNDNGPISSGNNRHNRTGDISTLIHGCNIDSATITRRCTGRCCNFVPRLLLPPCQGITRTKRYNNGCVDVRKTPALMRGGKSSQSYAPHLCIPPRCRRFPCPSDLCCIPTEARVKQEGERVTA